jgi:nicotinate-nucleotide adenylyltransferase
MPKKAILGGTFNPIHWGHLLMAETALVQLALDQVIWVPARRPLHKASSNLADFEKRMDMVKLAIASHPHFMLSTLEQNSSTSYAIDTFLDLQRLYPDTLWHWIIGFDAFQSLPRWYRRHDWIERCIWLVAPRWEKKEIGQGEIAHCQHVAQKLSAEAIELQWQLLDMPLIGLSSGLIRHYCRDRRSIRYLVPEPVRHYILEHDLYTKQN